MSQKRAASPMVEDDIHKRRGRPPNTTRITSALHTTMAVSNIELDLPDTPRPFHVVNTIPLSVEEPTYDDSLGENLLSVKDSATLYNSLIISRQNWLYNNEMGVFKQYWSRKEELIEKANMELELAKIKEDPADDEIKLVPVELVTSKRKNMNKLCECVLQLGPHSFDIRLFIVKNEAIEKKFKDEQTAEEEKTGIKVKEEEDEDEDDEKADSDDDEHDKKDTELNGLDKSLENTKEIETEDPVLGDNEKKRTQEIVKIEDDELTSKTKEKATPKKKGPGKGNRTPKTKKPVKLSDMDSKIETIADKGKQSSPESRPLKREIQQSLENHIMIANLNSLARSNSSLNDLMKTVASGGANTKQIAEFQKYIVQAKDMGDPTGSHAKTYHLQIKQQKLDQKLAEKKLRSDEKQKQQLEKLKQKELKKELKRLEKEREKELKQEAKKIRKLEKQKARQTSQGKKKKDPSFKIVKTKLTALQERYLYDATLSFEFSENSSARYLLPKDCIMEKLETGEILMSFIIVHNQSEITQFEEEEAKREEEKLKTESAPAEDLEVTTKKPAHRRKRGRFGPVRRLSTRGSAKEPELPLHVEKPKPVYSTITIMLTDVPAHCGPLILNSADPLEEVQLKMNSVFDEGDRQEVDYVWYQLDGITDEILAELLRHNLTTLEAQNVKRAGGTGRRKATD